jgi:hypothetical protein
MLAFSAVANFANLMGRLEQFDGVAIRVFEQDLPPAGTDFPFGYENGVMPS